MAYSEKYSLVFLLGFQYFGGMTMKDIGWETSEEKRRNIGLQHAIGALENGWIGNQTLTEMAAKLCPEIFPLTVGLFIQLEPTFLVLILNQEFLILHVQMIGLKPNFML